MNIPFRRGRWEPQRCLVMGILNATPDSFSDGGENIQRRINQLLDEGADIIDVGGESTRPGAAPVPLEAEVARVLPAIQAIRDVSDVPISIDTQKPGVARLALEAGADMVNDVRGLTGTGMVEVVREAGCAAILMRYEDLRGDMVAACESQLQQLTARAIRAGVDPGSLIVDPGLGFGKRPGPHVEDNLALVDAAGSFGFPSLIGASRKRFIGTMMNEPEPARRVAGSVEVAVRAQLAGASIVRVHDVAATRDALAR